MYDELSKEITSNFNYRDLADEGYPNIPTIRIVWKWSGTDWHEKGKTRLYTFDYRYDSQSREMKIYRTTQYDLFVEECEGNFSTWHITVDMDTSNRLGNTATNMEMSRRQICDKMAELTGISVADNGIEYRSAVIDYVEKAQIESAFMPDYCE